jgi:hypothetical protein
VKCLPCSSFWTVPNIAVKRSLYENNYGLTTLVSNKDGIIQIAKEWLTSEIDKTINLSHLNDKLKIH